jgi:hypothetical protein
VKRQFIVKVKGAQSVSTRPVSGAIASLGLLGEPPIYRFQPGGVRKIASMWKVITPLPKGDTAGVGLDSDRLEATGVQHLPPMAVGDFEGQAAISEGLGGVVPPRTGRRRWPYQRGPSGVKIGDQVHRSFPMQVLDGAAEDPA